MCRIEASDHAQDDFSPGFATEAESAVQLRRLRES
jgi:hypothetical protein